MNQVSVCIIFGGVSSEHEVSLRSAASVLSNIDREKFLVHMLGITKEGRWLYYNGPVRLIENGRWHDSPYARPGIISPDRGHRGILLAPYKGRGSFSSSIRHRIITGKKALHNEGAIIPIDTAFPVLHGKNGEDGTIQGLFALAGIPCVGAGVFSSAACMDKEATHIILERAGIKKTRLIGLRKAQISDLRILETRLSSELGYPMFVKPANAGSSVGVTKVKGPEDLEEALDLAFSHDEKVVVEQAVTGREVECAVIGNDNPIAAEVLGEIAPTREFYDYEGKYLDDSTKLHIPARISPEEAARVRSIAIKAYTAMDCRGFARIDFFVRGDGEAVLNEINTIPGFTSISMFPKLFEASGKSYKELITDLILTQPA